MEWLLDSDPAIRWQVMRDLAGEAPATFEAERAKVASEGWGAALLAEQQPDGRWGGGLYSPKWTSTFYTMQLLHLLGMPPGQADAQRGANILLETGQADDGGLDYGPPKHEPSETCISGMGLATAAYFLPDDERLPRLVEYCLREQMADGGWNCWLSRGATHASFNTSISVLEGLLEWEQASAPDARVAEARQRGVEFLLNHRMFRSHRTGEIVRKSYTMLAFPGRWHYDILRGLEFMAASNSPRDERATEAIEIVRKKRRTDGTWPAQNRYPGQTFFEMEPNGRQSRWNTLRALRVLRWWDGASDGSPVR